MSRSLRSERAPQSVRRSFSISSLNRAISACAATRSEGRESNVFVTSQGNHSQGAPVVSALAHAVDKAEQLLLALRRGADDDEDALRLVLQTRLQVCRWRPSSPSPMALGFWNAIGEVWPKTGEQRCRVHKTANILSKLPKSQQPNAKRMLQDIWMAGTRKDAEAALDAFVETYAVKYETRAILLASATATSVKGFFSISFFAHVRSGSECGLR